MPVCALTLGKVVAKTSNNAMVIVKNLYCNASLRQITLIKSFRSFGTEFLDRKSHFKKLFFPYFTTHYRIQTNY